MIFSYKQKRKQAVFYSTIKNDCYFYRLRILFHH